MTALSSVPRSQTKRRSTHWRQFRRELKRYQLGYVFLAPAMIILIFVDFVPMARGMWTSLHSFSLFRPRSKPFVGLQNYRDLLHDSLFWRALGQTAYYTLASVACQFLLGLLAAVLLNQSVRFRAFFRGLVLIPWVVPGALAGMMFALLFTSNGLVNTVLYHLGLTGGIIPENYPWLSHGSTAMPVLIFTSAWKGFPFFAVMFLAAMQAVPSDLYEAARVDGASKARSFWHVTVPGIRATMLIASLLGLIWTFNSIDLIYVMTYGGPYYSTTTLVMLAYQQAFGVGQVGYATAIAMVILVLMGLVTAAYLYAYRRLVRSI
ncbi:MAG: multiple sugar transport system permease protein [Pseudonocardiales bacterium]|jgi:multiple sugar transport system permease protein|nr:multiple sugar transport system permease protein [Pseudonocardiales bacterium]